MSRRRFVGMLAAGSAAIVAAGGTAAAPAPARKKRPAAASGAESLSLVDRKELDRQRASTNSTLEVIRKHAMPPGTEMASIFKPLRARRSGR
jgi:hypothetical protein